MNNASILLLMSDDVERLRLEQLLRHAGHEVISESSVERASEHLAVEPLDLFICEFQRGDDDRIALLTAAKWRLPYLARLLLISETYNRIAQKALETGIVHFTLVPPVSNTVLQDTTQALLRWSYEKRTGTPAPQTGRNPEVRGQLRETVDDEAGCEKDLLGASEPAKDKQQPSPRSSSARGRVEWYY